MKAAQAMAMFDGMDFVTPEQIQELAVPVIAHRLVMEPQARFSGVDGARRGGGNRRKKSRCRHEERCWARICFSNWFIYRYRLIIEASAGWYPEAIYAAR